MHYQKNIWLKGVQCATLRAGTPYKITGSWSDNIDKVVTIQK